MNCEIIAVGSELLTPYRQDTNSLFLTDRLLQLGVNVTFKTIVGDRLANLANAIRNLVGANAHGVLNITNSGSCSRFEFAREILRKAGRKTRVLPITSAEAGSPARRPAYSVLSSATLASHGISLRSWGDALDAYLEDLRQKGKLR